MLSLSANITQGLKEPVIHSWQDKIRQGYYKQVLHQVLETKTVSHLLPDNNKT